MRLLKHLVVLLVVAAGFTFPVAAAGQGPHTRIGIDHVSLAVQEADRIDDHKLPYSWGGGHTRRPGSPKQVHGYDCSGSVSRVLYKAKLIRHSMTASDFMRWGKPGRGVITVYARSTHVVIAIRGKVFGTSGKNHNGGAGWFKPDKGYLKGFTARRMAIG